MKFIKILLIIVGVVLTSFYLFPFEFVVLPGINTKMAMAAVGLVIFVSQMAYGRVGAINWQYLLLGVLALLVSIASFAAMTINNTKDNAYLGYIITLLVWLGGAYCATRWMKLVHGKVSVDLVSNYLIAVCVIQCILALLIDNSPQVKIWVNSHIGSFGGMGTAAGVDKYDRLYGIGAALDIAGSRFAAIMILIAAMIKQNSKYIWFYILSFIIISIIGNMIARTTTVGVILAIVYLIVFKSNETIVKNKTSFYLIFSTLLLCVVMIVSYFYNVNPQFRDNFRFGFEGFFSLFETGTWQSQSNDILVSMFRAPETLRTWMVGDGYMHNPMSDPYYLGYHWKGFYMGTDVGYLRFIYYFGIWGLAAMIAFIVYSAKICMTHFPKYTAMFVSVLLANLIIWFKVSTDLLVIFAIFLCIKPTDSIYETPLPDQLDE